MKNYKSDREIKFEISSEEYVNLWNTYCEEENYPDDIIYSMNDFDEIMYGLDPYTIACRVTYGEFNANDDFFCFNGYGNIKTMKYPELSEDFDTLIEWAKENEREEIEEFIIE